MTLGQVDTITLDNQVLVINLSKLNVEYSFIEEFFTRPMYRNDHECYENINKKIKQRDVSGQLRDVRVKPNQKELKDEQEDENRNVLTVLTLPIETTES